MLLSRLVAMVLPTAVLFAGCASSSPPTQEGASFGTDADFAVAETTADLGAVEGVVIDESLLPVPNATVRLSDPRDKQAPVTEFVTPVDGRFIFSRLEPGTYQIAAQASTFAGSSLFVQVVAAEITKARLMLEKVPGDEPYLEVLIHTGQIDCTATFIVTGFNPGCDFMFRAHARKILVPDGFAAIVTETVWRSPGETLRIDAYINDTSSTEHPMRMEWGGSPVRLELIPGVLYPPHAPVGPGLTPPKPVPHTSFLMVLTAGYYGYFQKEINQTFGPVCNVHPLGHCSGVGVATQLRYTHYVSVFVFGAPPDLRLYTALPDQ